ncbi:MAG TPA: peptidoglycan-binding domain-containing protein [Chthoniobacterales bacterium]
MIRKLLLAFFGLALLLGGAPGAFGGPNPATAQTTTKKKKASSKSKSKRKSRMATQKAPTPDRIREIQSALQREGAYQGDPSGKWDDATVAAMKNFQDKNGLSPTGKIDARTLEKLNLGSETAGKGAPMPAVPNANSPANSAR